MGIALAQIDIHLMIGIVFKHRSACHTVNGVNALSVFALNILLITNLNLTLLVLHASAHAIFYCQLQPYLTDSDGLDPADRSAADVYLIPLYLRGILS